MNKKPTLRGNLLELFQLKCPIIRVHQFDASPKDLCAFAAFLSQVVYVVPPSGSSTRPSENMTDNDQHTLACGHTLNDVQINHKIFEYIRYAAYYRDHGKQRRKQRYCKTAKSSSIHSLINKTNKILNYGVWNLKMDYILHQ